MMIEYTVKVTENGSKFWYLNGKFHREDGPACEHTDGTKYWYINGKLHREDGPAIEWADGSKSWYLNDELHREDGPAIEWDDGTKSWYLNGEKLSEQEHRDRMSPVKVLSVADIEQLLGHRVKIVK